MSKREQRGETAPESQTLRNHPRSQRLCRLTFLCSSDDRHPTDTGYKKIANQIFDVAGYDDLKGDGQ